MRLWVRDQAVERSSRPRSAVTARGIEGVRSREREREAKLITGVIMRVSTCERSVLDEEAKQRRPSRTALEGGSYLGLFSTTLYFDFM
jgi:hypothetical protein